MKTVTAVDLDHDDILDAVGGYVAQELTSARLRQNFDVTQSDDGGVTAYRHIGDDDLNAALITHARKYLRLDEKTVGPASVELGWNGGCLASACVRFPWVNGAKLNKEHAT